MKERKTAEKVTQKMTRDGAVTENHATGETVRISHREPQRKLSHPAEKSAPTPIPVMQQAKNRQPRFKPAPRLRAHPMIPRLHMEDADQKESSEAESVSAAAGCEGLDQMRTASAAAQRRSIKRRYATQWRRDAAQPDVKERVAAVVRAKRAIQKAAAYIKRRGKRLLILGIPAAMVLLLFAGLSAASFVVSGVGSMVTSSYLSEDADMLAAEAAYCAMENELRAYLDDYKLTHDFDEYRFDFDDIEHDPYVLISILSALHSGCFTIDAVQTDLQMLFKKQYILTENVEVETRCRTEVQTDEEGNEQTVEVAYDYTIIAVTLENFDLSHVPVYIMDEQTLALYSTYMATLGNREDLFPDSAYVGRYTAMPPNYNIPASALEDETFAVLIAEAEKYIGYPYVWGGSNPSTSFDCSGFVSWVLTNSGLCNTGRLGAQGLYNISAPVSTASARPGDLVFFVGTYDTPGISHVGIYVGDGMMLHCGDPIRYVSINTSYWQAHFYAFARPPYNEK